MRLITREYGMPTTLDNSIPIDNVHCLSHFLLYWYFSISHTVIAHLLRVNFT